MAASIPSKALRKSASISSPAPKTTPWPQQSWKQPLSTTRELASRPNPGLADEGYVYIPAACKVDATCRIHVAFHGCLQNHDTVGDEFVKHTGFARWADANGIVVLFPQVASGNLSNPQGCWDWWGYTGSDYLTHDAPQIEAIYSMLEKLAGSRTLGSGQNANK